MNIFSWKRSSHLLSNRNENEAYDFAGLRKQYAVYFTNSGSLDINLSEAIGAFSLQWLSILEHEWKQFKIIDGKSRINLNPFIVTVIEITRNQKA
jgi:hypothetical protein